MADLSGLMKGQTVELLVRGKVYGQGTVTSGVYLGDSAAGTFIYSADVVGFTIIAPDWQDQDAVRLFDDTFVRNADGFWFDSDQAQVVDEQVNQALQDGSLRVLYAPGRS